MESLMLCVCLCAHNEKNEEKMEDSKEYEEEKVFQELFSLVILWLLSHFFSLTSSP